MKTKIIIVLTIFLSFNIACDDSFLDTTPYDSIASGNIFANDTYALNAVNGAYNSLAQHTFSANFYVLASVLGPEGYGRVRGDWGISQGMGIADDRNAQYLNVYRNFYRTIIYSNDIISGLEENTAVTEALRDQYIGEAKFLRGLCYFYLMHLYGGVVILDKPIPVEEAYLPRNTKEEVFNFIVGDFIDAISKLPLTNDGRATKGAAIAMLGKTYLYNEQWAEAAGQFEQLLNAPFEYELVEDYADNFRFYAQNNEESVFEIQYAMMPGAGSAFNNWLGTRVTGSGAGQDYVEMSQRAFKVFTYANGSLPDFSTMPQREDYGNDVEYGNELTDWYQEILTGVDQRLHDSSILPGSTYLGYTGLYKYYWPISVNRGNEPPGLWHTFGDDAIIPVRKLVTVGQENSLARTNGPTNLPVIRFADVLLMYAEAVNETSGPTPGVYDAVDRVRERAGVEPLTTLKPGISKEEMRREIWLERFREFMYENVLFFDVRRWKVAHTDDPVFGLNHTEVDFREMTEWYDKVFREDRDYLWPIPGAEIDVNPLMEQNPNW